MSHFIANSLTISKDFKQFKVKGGDNNVVPRSNYWTDWIDINNLLDMLSSGSLQFGSSHNEKFLMLTELSIKYKKEWGGDWNQETDMYHSFRKGEVPSELEELNKRFIEEVKQEYKGISKKEYYVALDRVYGGNSYVNSVSWSRYKSSSIWHGSWHSAKKFGKYQAQEIARKWGGKVVTELIKD